MKSRQIFRLILWSFAFLVTLSFGIYGLLLNKNVINSNIQIIK